VSSGGRGTQVQGELNISASTRVGGDLRDGLTRCQSRSNRLPREETAFSQCRGA